MVGSRTRFPWYEGALNEVRHFLTRGSLPAILAGGAVLLTAPSIGRGLAADDLIHRTKLLSLSFTQSLANLFVFVDEQNARRLIDVGAGPWWGLETLRIAFFRPVTAATHWLDYRLWPDSPACMHLHSILWYACVCLLVTFFFRRLIRPGWIAGLAAFLFVVDDAHTVPVVWLANRNALVAVFFGLLTVMAHDRWRRDGHRASALYAILWLALTVLSAEIGVATVAYLVAYELFLGAGRWPSRLAALAPYALVVGAWQLVYHHMGYGAWGSAYYLDPAREPLRFAVAVAERAPVLLIRQWVWPYPTLYNMLSDPASRVFWAVGLFVIALVCLALAPLLKSDRTARFWATGMLLSVVPVCAKDSADGATLIFVGLGAMGLMAQFIAGLLERAAWLPVRRSWQVSAWTICGVFVAIHTVHAPIQLVAASFGPDPFGTAVERFTDIGSIPDLPDRDVVIVNAPSPLSFVYLEDIRAYRKLPLPAHVRVLAPGYFSVEIARLDSHTVVVEPENGYLVTPSRSTCNRGRLPLYHPIYVAQKYERAARSGSFPGKLGQRVDIAGVRITVMAITDDERPAAAEMRFARQLDDPHLLWLRWDWQRSEYVAFSPPAIGQRVRVPGLL